ncbi:histidine phosphatase family protein [Patulibacter sp.]|uniref:histidine phosphatase family protein n=1 Tax=Patulibacter sp. TaxID=1912859 RepID=UPI002720E427|nr:histidine phosphatase family protein [Patulibacter sp.]MDO9409616.1 histidine phosphatase family protein [Patulibacter sp.]
MSANDDVTAPRAVDPQRLFTLPAGATEVLLVRHGSTAGVEAGGVFPVNEHGDGDPPLSDDGEAQARLVGERLAHEPISRLFVTTLRRTHQTAARLVELTGLQPEVVADLREIHLGDWDAGEYRVRIADRDPLIMRSFVEQRWDIIPGAEQDELFAERVRRGFDHVVAQAGPDTTVAAVVHGGVIAEMCRQATGSEAFAFLGADNTSVNRFVVFPDGRLRLRSYNDTGHLDGLRDRPWVTGSASQPIT